MEPFGLELRGGRKEEFADFGFGGGAERRRLRTAQKEEREKLCGRVGRFFVWQFSPGSVRKNHLFNL